MATIGEDVTLECEVDAHPIPKLSFSRDSNSIDKLVNSTKYDVRVLRESRVRCVNLPSFLVLTFWFVYS